MATFNEGLAGGGYAQLRAFVAAAQALSFSGAARQLGVSPSALSQTIRSLEARTGTRLFNRTTRSVSLTEAGETLLQRAAPALEALGAALQGLGRTDEAEQAYALYDQREALKIVLTP